MAVLPHIHIEVPAASREQWLSRDGWEEMMLEALPSPKRTGAGMMLTAVAKESPRLLASGRF
jgi:hypothetical protein